MYHVASVQVYEAAHVLQRSACEKHTVAWPRERERESEGLRCSESRIVGTACIRRCGGYIDMCLGKNGKVCSVRLL